MSNVHGLSSFRNSNSSSDDDEDNNRYVGGVSARGGGSGLAVEPNRDMENDILGTIRSNATEAIPNEASASTSASASSTAPSSSNRRVITMYRSGFTIDNGPHRRLDDPTNAEFLRDLARGVTPHELLQNMTNSGADDGASGSKNGDMEIGLLDKRHMEYDDDANANTGATTTAGGGGGSSAATTAFTGVGQSLGSTSTASSAIPASKPSASNDGSSTNSTTQPPVVDESKPMTTIQIRLVNGKKLIIKCNLDDTIQILVSHIQANDNGGCDSNGSYVLSSGYPPKVLDDLNKTVEECGLKNALVIQKRA
mmetsp:Transcript_28932/g.33241  ORF Transcript_28932/g.33241 Transcript_28932/m.33241 type:complete len:310 (-) Transcript_28932:375-1304(-)